MKFITKKLKDKYFHEVLTGEKTFELRRDEDDIQTGDVITFVRVDNNGQFMIPPKHCNAVVKYTLRDFEGLKHGYIIYSIRVISQEEYDKLARKDLANGANNAH